MLTRFRWTRNQFHVLIGNVDRIANRVVMGISVGKRRKLDAVFHSAESDGNRLDVRGRDMEHATPSDERRRERDGHVQRGDGECRIDRHARLRERP